jgi:dihydroorotase
MAGRYLRGVQLLDGPGQPLRVTDVLLEDSRVACLGEAAAQRAHSEGLEALTAERWLLAPPLVDAHSVLEDPFGGTAETLDSLERSAAAAGYGTVALLPEALTWRDRPERMLLRPRRRLRLPLWGSFSVQGEGTTLAAHAEQLAAGAIGLAEVDRLPSIGLLEAGLQLGEVGERPVLLPPLDPALRRDGFVREGVEALRAGWPLDPVLSETHPLEILLGLAAQHPGCRLRLSNLSTAAAVERLGAAKVPPMASVCWWHLVADSGCLDPLAEGWRVVPSLGGPGDRAALIQAVADGRIAAVAVDHRPLDAEERLLPLDQRRPGLAGHRYVLPALWQELVVRHGLSIPQLWWALCWGPARFLGLEEERIEVGSDRWILFDPGSRWKAGNADANASMAANQPFEDTEITGRVLATGLLPELWLG